MNSCASTGDDSIKVASTDARVTKFIIVSACRYFDRCEEGGIERCNAVDSDRSIAIHPR